jgi:hypothetical protein
MATAIDRAFCVIDGPPHHFLGSPASEPYWSPHSIGVFPVVPFEHNEGIFFCFGYLQHEPAFGDVSHLEGCSDKGGFQLMVEYRKGKLGLPIGSESKKIVRLDYVGLLFMAKPSTLTEVAEFHPNEEILKTLFSGLIDNTLGTHTCPGILPTYDFQECDFNIVDFRGRISITPLDLRFNDNS